MVISDEGEEIRIHKNQILFYKIERISSLNLRITLRDQEVIRMPIDGFFSERRIVGVFETLGITKG